MSEAVSGWETCQLCGIVGMPTTIRVFLAAWRDEQGWRPAGVRTGKPYDAIDRCIDAQKCRDRYETGGKIWPLDDTTVPTRPVAVKVVSQQPMQVAATAEGLGTDEEAAWLR